MITAYIIRLIHIIFVIFVLFGILFNDPLLLLLYLATLISLQLHWYTNNDVCFLTLLERILLGKTNEESFMHQIVSPIYKIPDKSLAYLSKVIVYVLIIGTLFKMYKKGYTPRKYYEIITEGLKNSSKKHMKN